MSYILFDHNKKVGEISAWSVADLPPVYKNVLGKIVLSTPANDECSFISPKPVNRRSKLTVILDRKWKFTLLLKSVKGSTSVIAKILRKDEILRDQ